MAATELSQQPATIDPLRHHEHYRGADPAASPYAGGSSFMERVSEAVASGMGTVGFLIISSGIILAWVLSNQANEEASARHRDELSQIQTDLLKRNTELTEQIHTVSETLTRLTEEVHEATCKPGASPA
jgi:hypothetical protein